MKKGGFFKRTVRDVPLHGKTVLVRADYNVPLTNDGEIDDDFRMVSSLPTIKYLLQQDCKVIICSHLGRPDGKVNDDYSLELVAIHLAKLLGQPVQFVPECIGDQVKQKTKKLQKGQVLLLENVRFHAGEEANDQQFAKLLAEDTMAEYFVQDGFGVVHRAHASTEAITQFIPSVAGLLLEKEYTSIRHTMDNPSRPLVAVLGGAKISDKIAVIETFVSIADKIVIGGAMANTFFKFHGYKIGKSVYEDGLDGVVQKIYDAAEQKVGKDNIDEFIILPTDVAVARKIDAGERRVSVAVDAVAADEYILDMGPESISAAARVVSEAKTVFWNGTMGYAELPQFAHGSARIALTLAANPDMTSVIGGGDTADFVLKWDAAGGESFTHVSTGGGASLDLMAGLPMPGINALLDA
jgi:3-phosphoglycerate kinase